MHDVVGKLQTALELALEFWALHWVSGEGPST